MERNISEYFNQIVQHPFFQRIGSLLGWILFGIMTVSCFLVAFVISVAVIDYETNIYKDDLFEMVHFFRETAELTKTLLSFCIRLLTVPF